MTHLNDEQFEDVLGGNISEPEHLTQCESCRNELTQRKAVRSRLRSAFSDVHPSRFDVNRKATVDNKNLF